MFKNEGGVGSKAVWTMLKKTDDLVLEGVPNQFRDRDKDEYKNNLGHCTALRRLKIIKKKVLVDEERWSSWLKDNGGYNLGHCTSMRRLTITKQEETFFACSAKSIKIHNCTPKFCSQLSSNISCSQNICAKKHQNLVLCRINFSNYIQHHKENFHFSATDEKSLAKVFLGKKGKFEANCN